MNKASNDGDATEDSEEREEISGIRMIPRLIKGRGVFMIAIREE